MSNDNSNNISVELRDDSPNNVYAIGYPWHDGKILTFNLCLGVRAPRLDPRDIAGIIAAEFPHHLADAATAIVDDEKRQVERAVMKFQNQLVWRLVGDNTLPHAAWVREKRALIDVLKPKGDGVIPQVSELSPSQLAAFRVRLAELEKAEGINDKADDDDNDNDGMSMSTTMASDFGPRPSK